MSINLLKYLNGNKNGYFKRYIDRLKNDPLIAWYPSAGNDFHPLLYLSPAYSRYNPPKENVEESFPDIFLFTDYSPWENFSFSTTIYQDKRTNITVNNIEELPLLKNLPLDPEIVLFGNSPKFFGYFPERSSANGEVIYLEVKVQSNILGEYSYPVIYVRSENEAFCSKVLLAENSKISHIIHVRYGGGLGGGGRASGIWILGVLNKLHCRVFITDNHYPMQDGDKSAMKLYPNLRGKSPSKMKEIRMIESRKWSYHGDVRWCILE